MTSDVIKKTIEVFYPLDDSQEALNKVVLEWLDGRMSRLEQRIMEFERKYGMEFKEFDDKVRKGDISFEEEDDWIDWSDSIELLASLKNYRREVLSQLKKH